jgi:sRNA-binding regulator protein Hfq
MANAPQIPAAGLSGLRSESPLKQRSANLPAVAPPENPELQKTEPRANDAKESPTLPVSGPRKLVRPTLPARALRNRAFLLHEESPILAHQSMISSAAHGESTHAEVFYFQKQVQSQTPMVIVLEDGERIEGCIEWYDHNAIKVRGASRTLIYKTAIKYIYKAGDRPA